MKMGREWTPTKKALPEDREGAYERYLITMDYEGEPFVDVAFWQGKEEGWLTLTEPLRQYKIIAWMPLPHAYSKK